MRISTRAPEERRCLASRWLFAFHGHLILSGAGLFLDEERLPATSCDAILPGGTQLSPPANPDLSVGGFPRPHRFFVATRSSLAGPVHSVRADAASGAWSELLK